MLACRDMTKPIRCEDVDSGAQRAKSAKFFPLNWQRISDTIFLPSPRSSAAAGRDWPLIGARLRLRSRPEADVDPADAIGRSRLIAEVHRRRPCGTSTPVRERSPQPTLSLMNRSSVARAGQPLTTELILRASPT